AHPRWVGMRVGFRDLTVWSFLTSTAHGAGLMLLPVLLGAGAHAAHAAHTGGAAGAGPALALTVHTAAMFTAMAGVAFAVCRTAGLGLLRRAWVNLDAVWVGAVVVAAVVTLLWT